VVQKTASTLHSLLKQMHAAQTKGEEGPTTSGITVLKQPRTIQRSLKSYQCVPPPHTHRTARAPSHTPHTAKLPITTDVGRAYQTEWPA
jgi:hypothetical protein